MYTFIKFILINLLFISLPILSSNASITSNNQGLGHLIAALTKIDKPKSLKVAKELTSSNNSYDLIIRRANLNILDADEISNAIKKISHQKEPLLKTISMSFNKDLKDEGIIKILNVLPTTTSTIAFVECGITDIGGQKIIDWAYNQKAIKQIYLEGNFFSKNIINQFIKLKKDKPDITMIIEWPSEGFKKMVLDNYK
ncbi:hypothetical protein N8870_02410 [Alphaproteobacteria bacterium]|nr:hypothetical protein [Alphaproteobacteria bacterium]